jgi:S1-C subfamily serine protease
VIGINSQVQSVPGRGVSAIAFAIPIDTAKALLERAGAGR